MILLSAALLKVWILNKAISLIDVRSNIYLLIFPKKTSEKNIYLLSLLIDARLNIYLDIFLKENSAKIFIYYSQLKVHVRGIQIKKHYWYNNAPFVSDFFKDN